MPIVKKQKYEGKHFSIKPTVAGVVSMLAAPALVPIIGAGAANVAMVGGASVVCSGVVGFASRYKYTPKKKGITIETVQELLDASGLKNHYGEPAVVTDIVNKKRYSDVYIKLSPGLRLEELQKRTETIGTYYHNSAMIISPQKEDENITSKRDKNKKGEGIYKVRIYKAQLPSLVKFKVIDVKEKINETDPEKYRRKFNESLWVCYGESRDGYEWINMAEEYILIAGEKGSGKSVLLRGFLCQMISNFKAGSELVLDLMDFKGGIELGDFKDVEHCQEFSKDPMAFDEYLDRLKAEMDERYSKIETQPYCKKLSDYNNAVPYEERMPFHVVVVEEFAALMGMDSIDKKLKDSIMKKLAVLLSQARASGILFILTTQRPCREVIPSIIKTNIDCRFGLRTVDENNSKIILDRPGCETLRGQGHGILKDGGDYTEFKAMYCTPRDAIKIAEAHKRKVVKEEIEMDDDKDIIEFENTTPETTMMHELLQTPEVSEPDEDDILSRMIRG